MALIRRIWKHKISLVVLIVFAAGSAFAVQRFHKPGQLDVIAAQAMDMSEMRPPSGAAPVELATVTQGSLQDSVTYTGTVLAYNEQVITPRITGRIISLPVYPGDAVRAGEVVARLDTQELSAKTAESDAMAQQARTAAEEAELTHHLHHPVALQQAADQVDVADESVLDAQAQEQSARDGISDAAAGVASAQAQADYWKTEIAREKQLADAGAASQQEYQNEFAQANSAQAALAQAGAKSSAAEAALLSAQAHTRGAKRQVSSAQSAQRMAEADLVLAGVQAQEARSGSAAASATASEAAVVQGYGTIVSPANAVVVARPASPGTLVDPGTPILTLAEIDRVRVQANVAVNDLDGIAVGSPVQISLSGESKPIHAFVTAVFPSANQETRTAVVETDLPNARHSLLPGAFVTMTIARKQLAQVLEVPADSIATLGGNSYVWEAKSGAASSGGRLQAHRVEVTAGASDGVLTELSSSDLHAGDRIVRQGQAGLSEGAHIVESVWGPNGPTNLPTAAQASHGELRYRCVVCGLTFSAADAKKDGYRDPMEGGKLVPIQ